MPTFIIIKLLKSKGKNKILKEFRAKQALSMRNNDSIPADFSSGTIKTKKK